MTKTKIAFAGFMGAILMSVGAANAVTTSVATKGYVDQQVKNVQEVIDGLGDTYVTMQDVADAIDDVDLSAYQTIANISQTLNGLTDEQKATRYPSVAAVAAAIESLDLGLTTEQITQLKELVQSDGVVAQIDSLKTRVDTLTGEGEGSIAKSIADAITEHNTAADGKYQAQSTAAYSLGNATGGWTPLTADEQAVLTSGITAEKVAAYDELAGDEGTIADMQATIDSLDTDINDAENGLKKIVTEIAADVADNADDIAKNAEDIAANTAEIANKITMPAECTAENSTCVLMSSNGTITWTPVTSPVED